MHRPCLGRSEDERYAQHSRRRQSNPFFTINPHAAVRVENLLHGEGFPSQCYLPLSHPSREVVCLVAQVMRNKVIAESLGVGVKTIETYRARASKLDFRNRSDFVSYALDQGWLTGA